MSFSRRDEKCSIAVKVWHSGVNVMYLSNICDNLIRYVYVNTIFKARCVPNK